MSIESTAQVSRPHPDLEDELWGPHWRGLADEELLFQRCSQCGQLRWPPAVRCPNCLSKKFDWSPQEPKGVIWSVAIYEQGYHPAFKGLLPYNVILVDLDSGIRYVSQMVGIENEAIEVGTRVKGKYVEVEPGLKLLLFEKESA
jgi:uncharacterized protein